MEKLAEYIASRRDLDHAGPFEIEAALKKAGKLAAGDHFCTAFHAGLKAVRIQRQVAAGDEWVSLGCLGAGTEEVYYRYRHAPCGTEIEVSQGHCWLRICPKCDAEKWAAERAKEGSPD